ncbi:MAG TPA: tetratricopeptide repeat protein [Syntrophales bacterium]|nr:tetratricopeptide repeat protein [Syntrophales bacterium]
MKPRRDAGGALPIDLPSRESMEGFLSGIVLGGERAATAVEEAQQVMYDAWDAPNRTQAVSLARKALAISADCADAYNLLAGETAGSLEEAIDLYAKGVEAGERALGRQAFEEDAGHFWGLLETRPYMRARAGLAECLWAAGRRDEAVAHFQELLRLNPNDNQGIRDLPMPRLIELGRDEDAEKLFMEFEGDGMAVWMYSRALLDFRKHGDAPVANASLKKALAENKHVVPYLAGRKKLPRELPPYYGFGDDRECGFSSMM